jgi:hypothetical protein
LAPAGRDESAVVFLDAVTGEQHVKTIAGLIAIVVNSDSILLASTRALVLCNRVGIPVGVQFVPFAPGLVALAAKFAIAITGSKLALWDVDRDDVKFVRLKSRATAIAAKASTLFVAFETQELVMFQLPTCDEAARYTLGSTVAMISCHQI